MRKGWVGWVGLLWLWLSFVDNASAKSLPNSKTDNETLLQQLNALSVVSYEHVSRGEFSQGLIQLKKMKSVMTSIDYSNITTVEGVAALSQSVIDAEKSLSAAKLEEAKALASVGRVRLATDALIHRKQPMWLDYYSVLKSDLKQLDTAIQYRRNDLILKQFAVLESHFRMIDPAVRISRAPEEVEKINSILTFVGKQVQLNSGSYTNLQSGVRQLSYGLEELFRKERSTLGPSPGTPAPISITVGIASIVITVLSFVAFKKFRAAKI